MSSRDLNRRHLRAIGVIARQAPQPVSLGEVRNAIGGNATNTIASLEARGLVRECWYLGAPSLVLTLAGRALLDELRQELAFA